MARPTSAPTLPPTLLLGRSRSLKPGWQGAVFGAGLLAMTLAGAPVGAQDQASEAGTATAVMELSPLQEQIFQIVTAPDGYVDRRLHKAFWADMPADLRKDKVALVELSETVQAMMAAGTGFQSAVWTSARASMEAGRVIRTPSLERATSRAKQAIEEARTASPSKDIAASDPAADSAKGLLDQAQAIEEADAVLEAAATGQPLITAGGPVRITPARIRSTMSSLDAAAARLTLLLAPDWAPRPVTTIYQEAGLSIDSSIPFRFSLDQGGGGQGEEVETPGVLTLTRRVGPSDFVLITVMSFSGPWRDAEGGMARLARTALANAGVGTPAVTLERWRDRVSAQGEASTDEPNGSVHAAVRLVDVGERRRAISILGLSTRSVEIARALRDDTLSAMRLLEAANDNDSGETPDLKDRVSEPQPQ